MMMPLDMDFVEWLDEDGELMYDAPDYIKESYREWKEHYDSWKKARQLPMQTDDS